MAVNPKASWKIVWILTLEILLAGAYVSLTRGLFVIYLASIGYNINSISLVMFSSALASIVFGLLIYKHPQFLTRRVKPKLIAFHASE
ncbi:MAG: hypothetical protein QXW39_01900, partial [Candidatus Bathyarchaeia archaeon]